MNRFILIFILFCLVMGWVFLKGSMFCVLAIHLQLTVKEKFLAY